MAPTRCLADVPWKLYSSRGISSWGDRMWMFAVGLFMIELSPGSLKWTAIYGLSQSLSIILLAPVIGRWVDRTPRLVAARVSLVWQNTSVVVCAICVTVTFHFRTFLETSGEGWAMTGACSLIVALGTVASLASVASSVVVNKDWVAVIAAGDKDALARMNATCRSIDLAVNILAPIVVGQIMYFISHMVAAVIIASWNVVSFILEYSLLWKIYKEFPTLAVKKMAAVGSPENRPLQATEEAEIDGDESTCCCQDRFTDLWKGWKIYFTHDIRNAGIGLACLYMTVLGFDSITTGYAYSQGVPESILGVVGALGAVVGLLGSLAFPAIVRWMGLERTGLWGFGLEVTCLTMCVASVWAPGSPFDPQSLTSSVAHLSEGFVTSNSSGNATIDASSVQQGPSSYTSIFLLMTGIITARFGLWVADLSVNQVLQSVDDEIRGTINGVQSSMNMMCNTGKLLLVIALPRPATFGFLICASFSAICLGWIFYATYSLRKRGHLLPFHRLCAAIPADELHQVTGPKIKEAADCGAAPLEQQPDAEDQQTDSVRAANESQRIPDNMLNT